MPNGIEPIVTNEDPTYIQGTVELAEINGAIPGIWSQLAKDPKYLSLAAQHPALAKLKFDGECPYLLSPKTAGIDHSMAALGLQVAIGVVTGLTKEALIALFNKAVLPKINKHVGVGALEEFRPPPS